jgi:pilus assembly protein CpaE
MQIYFFTAGVESNELVELERRISSKLPSLRKIIRIDEVMRRLAANGAAARSERIFVIFPVLAPASSLERVVEIAEQGNSGVFSIFISQEISASDYKRLVRSGSADWVSLQGAPQEILDIISRATRTESASVGTGRVRPAIAAFVPSGGGVGNATLAIESVVQIKTSKATRDRRVCLLDIDLQTSHVCDSLDIEPRLQMKEIVDNPERLDAQLFDLYLSRHATTGVDVLAVPRNREVPIGANIAALDALFRMISERYDLVVIDLPPAWSEWTGQIISICDLVVVTGLNNVPGLRQVAETLKSVRSAARLPAQVVVALNRCEARLIGGVARRQYVNRVLGHENVFYVREDAVSANHSLNTGVPITIGDPSSRIVKDIRPLASLVSGLTPAE